MKIDYYGISDRGKVREENQDQFLIADLHKSMLVYQTNLSEQDCQEFQGMSQGRLFAVADGIGGVEGGREASSLALKTLRQYVLNTMPWYFAMDRQHPEELRISLEQSLEMCQERLRRRGEIQQTPGMGTTLTLAYVLWPMLYITHIGDSRAYLFRPSQSNIQQLTTDHTVAQGMIDSGMKPEDMKNSPYHNVLAQQIGGKAEEIDPEFRKIQLVYGDVLVLCTDGLTRYVSEEKLESVIQAGRSAKEVGNTLVQMARDGGGRDNITVLVASFAEQGALAESFGEAALRELQAKKT